MGGLSPSLPPWGTSTWPVTGEQSPTPTISFRLTIDDIPIEIPYTEQGSVKATTILGPARLGNDCVGSKVSN